VYPTIAAPPPQLYSDKPALRPPKKRATRFVLIIAVGLVVIAILGVIIVALLFANGRQKIPANIPANRSTTNSNHKSTSTSGQPPSICFAEDATAGVRDREAHYTWAKDRDAAAMTRNLMYKADLLFHCPSMNADSLSSAFADISVTTARYVPDARCFDGDEGVIGTDRAAHKNAFANSPARMEHLLGNLKWKMGAALNCLHQSEQASYFADVSVLMANAPE